MTIQDLINHLPLILQRWFNTLLPPRIRLLRPSSFRLPLKYLIPIWCVLTLIFTGFFLWSIPDLTRYEQSSRSVTDSEGNILSYTRSADDKVRLKTTVDKVDPLYLKMLLASEDQRFYSHFGVDPLAIARAFISNIKSEHIVSGASTLAMQTARALEPHPRTLLYKLKEACAALYLTLNRGREGVLNLYLTMTPFGADIEGVKLASLRWFGHTPEHLSPEEAALLVALPRAPELIRPDLHPNRASYYVKDVLRLAVAKGILSEDTAQAAANAPLPKKLLSFTQHERGLASYLQKNYRGDEITTTIDPRLENFLLDLGAQFRAIHPAPLELAAVIIDRKSNCIAGYLGSADESNFLPLAHAVRSPGSALKPFAYALAFEQELLHPYTLLCDEQEIFGSFMPRNYSGKFKGVITAEEALIYSLNIPALKVMQSISPEFFLQRLNHTHEVLKTPPHTSPSLAIALGGVGISLYDLTVLYAVLEEDGELTWPKLVLKEQQNNETVRILKKGSARAVSEILKKLPAPQGLTKVSELSYKTGTSWGSRDAWALGSLGDYTAGVWIGRPDGMSVGTLSGYTDAAPILYKILTTCTPFFEPKEPLKSSESLPQFPPELLKDLRHSKHSLDPHTLSIEFPKDRSIIAPGRNGRVYLMLKGGIPPFYLNVNGHGEETHDSFVPKTDGPHCISVLDSAGHSSTINIDIRLK